MYCDLDIIYLFNITKNGKSKTGEMAISTVTPVIDRPTETSVLLRGEHFLEKLAIKTNKLYKKNENKMKTIKTKLY